MQIGTHCSDCGPQEYASFSSLADAVGSLTNTDGVFEGSLFIEGTTLASLDGMQPVRHIAGAFNVRFNDDLVDISALASLESVGDHFFIQYNNALPSLDGLESLSFIGENFLVWNNSALETVRLDSLNETAGALVIQDHCCLRSIAIDNLQTVGMGFEEFDYDYRYNRDYLDINYNLQLESLNLSSLRMVPDSLLIVYNPNLTSLDIDQLEGCGNLNLNSNNLGPTFSGINNLEETGYLEFNGNPLLVSIEDAFNGLKRTVNYSLAISGGDVYGFKDVEGSLLASVKNSFQSLESVGFEFIVNMTTEGQTDISGSFGSLADVAKCCYLRPESLTDDLPACVGKLCSWE